MKNSTNIIDINDTWGFEWCLYGCWHSLEKTKIRTINEKYNFINFNINR